MPNFWSDAIKQLGISAVLCAMLFLYAQSESKRWDERMQVDETRWQKLFDQSQQSAKDALNTIQVCCHERLLKLEEVERDRR